MQCTSVFFMFFNNDFMQLHVKVLHGFYDIFMFYDNLKFQ